MFLCDIFDDDLFVYTNWGAIGFNKEYLEVVQSNDFLKQQNKLQLGLCHGINASGSRENHSFGVGILAKRFVDTCKDLLRDVVTISDDDYHSVILWGLLHDFKHHALSHSAESVLKLNHEEAAIETLKDPNSQMHKIIVKNFGINVLNNIISLFDNKIEKSSDFLRIIQPFLSGPEDIDRIEYMYTDATLILGPSIAKDFTFLLNDLDYAVIDGQIKLVYKENAIPHLIDFHQQRFKLHDIIYYSSPTSISETLFQKYAKTSNIPVNLDDTLHQIRTQFRALEYTDSVVGRFAYLLNHNFILDSNLMFHEVYNEDAFNQIVASLYQSIPELQIAQYDNISNSCLHTSKRKMKLYNSKYSTYIKFKDGSIKTLNELNALDCNYEVSRYSIAFDSYLLAKLTGIKQENINDQVQCCFDSKPDQRKNIHNIRI